ncbi:MAG: pyruvate kinase [Chloroflexi bacterium]|nr:pyruvate kinase [Chloroflexota bacterium]MYJ91936.1 pyruvate kinase [Chloroflexota bacterium]
MTSRRRAKIVATLGPASSDPDTVLELVNAGLDVARINFSHGDETSWMRAVESVRQAQAATGKPVAILGDLQGPKIRIGSVPDGTEIARGERVDIVVGSDADASYDDNCLTVSCSYAALVDELEVGGRVYLRDGELDLLVEEIDGNRIRTTVRGGGLLTARAGLHAPGAGQRLPAVTDQDREHIGFAVRHGFDFLALSFVRSALDLAEAGAAVHAAGGEVPFIAKIETISAIDDLQEIIAVSDGVMVARGDLGVEVGPAEVPVLQRQIIEAAGRALLPVIIATQMLESMVQRQRPTRAEASDVANAVWDGADALMLSAETAVGRHPVEVVAMMDDIIHRAETGDAGRAAVAHSIELKADAARTIAVAVAAAVEQHPQVKAVIVFTISGRSGRLISHVRLPVPVLVLAPDDTTLQRLALMWGVTPRHCPPPTDIDRMLREVEQAAVDALDLTPGDQIVLTGGFPLGQGEPTNFLKLHQIPPSIPGSHPSPSPSGRGLG